MNISRMMGIGRWGLIGGVTILVSGFFLAVPLIAWAGVGVAALGLLINTAGKFSYYAHVAIPREQRLLVMATWLAVALTLIALLIDYTYARLTRGYESLFWAFVIGAVGCSAIYWGLRTKYVSADSPSTHN